MKSFTWFLLLLVPATVYAQSADTLLIHFDFNKSSITPQAASALDSFLRIHNAEIVQQINLYGHCDAIGNDPYNDALSLQRIAATRKYLRSKGVADSIFTKQNGFGKRQPLIDDTIETARAMNRRVQVIVRWKKYLPPPPPKTTLTEVINDTSVKAGTNIILKNINFEGGRHFLLSESFPALQELLTAMKNNPTLVIEIQGHICCYTGNEDGPDLDLGTNDLSVQRAKYIYEFLIDNGISADRLSYRGFGASHKIYQNEASEEEKSKNRRVEIKIIRK